MSLKFSSSPHDLLRSPHHHHSSSHHSNMLQSLPSSLLILMNGIIYLSIYIYIYSRTLKCRIFAYIQRHIGNAICYWAFYARHILYISYLGTWNYKFNKTTLLWNFSPMIEMVYVVGQIKTFTSSMFSSLHPFIHENVGSLHTDQTLSETPKITKLSTLDILSIFHKLVYIKT